MGAHASNWGFAEPSSSSSSTNQAAGGRGSLGGSRSSSPIPPGGSNNSNNSNSNMMMDVTSPVPSSPQPPLSRLSTSRHSNRAGTSQVYFDWAIVIF